MSNQKDLDLIHENACQTHGRVVWTHKAHEIERERITRKAEWLNITNIGFAALTTGLAVFSASPLIHDPRTYILTAISAAINVCLVVTTATMNYPEKEAQQRTAAKELLCLRDQLEQLITDCQMSDADPMPIRKALAQLQTELHRAYRFVPNTSRSANNETSKRINAGEMIFTEHEKKTLLTDRLRAEPSANLTPGDTGAGQLPKACGQD